LVIHKDKESFLVVPLLALKLKKDLSEITLVFPRKTWESLGIIQGNNIDDVGHQSAFIRSIL